MTIPSTVTTIGDLAFYGCVSLPEVVIPASVTSVGARAFESCEALTSMTIPACMVRGGNQNEAGTFPYYVSLYNNVRTVTVQNGATAIGQRAFQDCIDLQTVNLPDGVTMIDEFAFSGCTAMTGLEMSSNVTGIGEWAFYNCDGMTAITLPSSLEEIGVYAFCGCYALKGITIPWRITKIADGLLAQCMALEKVAISENVTGIGAEAFRGCYALKGISIPAGVTVLEPRTFYACTGLERVELTTGLTAIGEEALIACQSLDHLAVPATVTSIGDEAFPRHEGFAILCDEYSYVESWARQHGYAIATLVSELLLPENVYVEVLQNGLTGLTIEPAHVIHSLTCETGDSVWASVNSDGLITGNAVGTTTLTVTDAYTGKTATATLRVTYPVTAIVLTPAEMTMSVGGTAQLNAEVTTKTESFVNRLVSFRSSDPAVVQVSPEGVVTACGKGLATIYVTTAGGLDARCEVTVGTIRRSVLPANLLTIEAAAFADCPNLLCVVIPVSVTSIAPDAFRGCDGLTIIAPEGSEAHDFAMEYGFHWFDQ